MHEDVQTIEKQLRDQALAMLRSSEHGPELRYLMDRLGIGEDEVIQAYVDYDLDVYAYGNEIYESLPIRIVLGIKYLMENCWHHDRQRVILDTIKRNGFQSIVDIGFGAPTLYVRDALKNRKSRVTLLDLYKSALTFAEAQLDYLDPNWRDVVSLGIHDMTSNEFVGPYDAYIFQDSIEHTVDPTKYLTKTVARAQDHAKFILSLPIGPPIPSHFFAWETRDEVTTWLKKCGLKIDHSAEIKFDPKVDLWAERIRDDFYNLVVECSKNVD